MSDNPKMPFQVPPEMVAMAEQSFEQARRAFDQFMNAAQSTIASFADQNKAAQASGQQVAGKIMSFAEENVANAFAHATGRRLRLLPMTPERVKAALA